METLLYANRAEPKYISVLLIVLLVAALLPNWVLLNYVACIGSVISLLRKIFDISDVNDAEPRLLGFKAEPRLSFSEKKTSPSRTETLAKRARADLRLLQNITESK